MNQELQQQIANLNLFLGMKLNGPSAWDFSGDVLLPAVVDVNGDIYQGQELQEIAIQLKREGEYDEVVGAYFHLLIASYKEYRKVSAALVRGYIKVLFAANEFLTAFSLLATMLADMQRASGVNRELASYIETDFDVLCKESVSYVDRGQFYSRLVMLTIGYSGDKNYELEKSSFEIDSELKAIRKKIREVYNM